MLIKQVIELFDLLDSPSASGNIIQEYFGTRDIHDVTVTELKGDKGTTDCIKVVVKGKNGRSSGGTVPTLGIIGRLGGLGARPEMTGFVSDGDGALAALAAALKLGEMHSRGDILEGDVIITTHICPDAPTLEHYPVPFMNSPISMDQMNDEEIDPAMEMILSIDTTKGNEIINVNGIALSPTVKEGYILPVSYDLLNVMKRVTGTKPAVFALSTQDITPYSNEMPHVNSILQPATATKAPVVGVAVTTESPVAGCATGATSFISVEQAARFVVEVAKDISKGICSFYSEDNFQELISRYGSMEHLSTPGK